MNEKLAFLIVALFLIIALLWMIYKKDKGCILFGLTFTVLCAFYLFQFGALSKFSMKTTIADIEFIQDKKEQIANYAEEISELSQKMKRILKDSEESQKRIEEIEKIVTMTKLDLSDLTVRYKNDYALFSSELTKLKQRNEITKLGDKAINFADRASFHNLQIIAGTDKDPDLSVAAGTQMRLVKGYWMTSSSVKPGRHTIDGRHGANLKTSELIDVLVTDKDSGNRNNRILAAKALRNRTQKGVPDALLKSIREDPDLEVVANSMFAFEDVTGFPSPDIFNYEPVEAWWKDKREEVNAKLSDPK